MNKKIIVGVGSSIILILCVLAITTIPNISNSSQPNNQILAMDTKNWQGNEIDVQFTVDPVEPKINDDVKIGVKFSPPGEDDLQEHIDYKMFITHEKDGLVKEILSHSGTGMITVPVGNVKEGVYVVSVEVIGILFHPIEKEKMFTHIIVE